jgi:hypothetical protein
MIFSVSPDKLKIGYDCFFRVVRFEVLTAASMKMTAFCVVALCSQGADFRPDDRGSKHL